MKIGIIGLGFVGLSFASVLGSKGYSVLGFDSDFKKATSIRRGIPPFYEPKLEETLRSALKRGLKISDNLSAIVNECKLIFITIGTPQQNDGSIDLSMIKAAMIEIGTLLKKTSNKPIIIVKSTVIPGSTRDVLLPILERKSGKSSGTDFEVITNPEFLRESMAIADTINPHVVVLGGNKNKFMNQIHDFYKKFQKDTPIVITNNQTAEIIKYTNNSFLATKISFINQISNICQLIPGANVEDVARTIGLDPRIGPLFLNAGPGYGGSCLPKDVKAIIRFSNKIGVKPVLLNAVESVNKYQLEHIISVIEKALGNIKDRKIAILGLAFKPDTDDIRDSVSIKLITNLLKNGAQVIAHDPKAIENTKKIFGDRINYTYSLVESLKGTECAVILTNWKIYSKLNNRQVSKMKKRIIVDTRRILKDHNLDITYYPIGIG
jgi:UDPglucose 6-dehydrogenase